MNVNRHRTFAFERKHTVIYQSDRQLKQISVIFSPKDCSLSLITHAIHKQVKYDSLSAFEVDFSASNYLPSWAALLDFCFSQKLICAVEVYFIENHCEHGCDYAADYQ